jgi:hypothetical protein
MLPPITPTSEAEANVENLLGPTFQSLSTWTLSIALPEHVRRLLARGAAQDDTAGVLTAAGVWVDACSRRCARCDLIPPR